MTDEQKMTDEPIDKTYAEEAAGAGQPEMRTEDVLRFSMSLFADLAWVKLGIRSNPATGDTQADLPQARLAIDALGALVQLSEGRFDPHEVRDLHNLLSSLQLNYVQRAAPPAE